MIHFYKRFQIRLLLPGPIVGLIELLRRPVEQQQKQQRGCPELRRLSFSPLVPGGLDNQGVRGNEWGLGSGQRGRGAR